MLTRYSPASDFGLQRSLSGSPLEGAECIVVATKTCVISSTTPGQRLMQLCDNVVRVLWSDTLAHCIRDDRRLPRL